MNINLRPIYNWKTLSVWIAVLVILLVFLGLLEFKNHSPNAITQNLQTKINSEFNSIKKNGDRFVYYKYNLVSWSNNDVPLPKRFTRNLNSDVIKLSNGYYILNREKKNDSIILYVSLIKKNYPINNSYLSNDFNPKFDLEDNADISITYTPTKYPIKINNKTSFFLDYSKYNHHSNSLLSYTLSLIFLVVLFLVGKLIQILINPNKQLFRWVFLLIAYIVLLLGLRFLDAYSFICNIDFSKVIISWNNAGFSALEVFSFQILTYLLIQSIDISLLKKNSMLSIQLLLIPVTWGYFYFISLLMEGFNEIISLAGIISFDVEVILLLFQVMFASYILYMVAKSLLASSKINSKTNKLTYIIILLASLLSILCFINKLSIISVLSISLALIILFVSVLKEDIFKPKLSPILYYIIILILYSVINGILLYSYNSQKERVFLETALTKISDSEDKEAEALLLNIEKGINADKQINDRNSRIKNKELEDYIEERYLEELNKTYSIEIIVCYANESLFIPPLKRHINSKEYFKSRLEGARQIVNSKSIYWENRNLTEKAYIGYFETSHQGKTRLIFIDCVEKKASKEMGYPDLLINMEAKEKSSQVDINYFVVYQHNDLVLQFGDYDYPMHLSNKQNNWYKENGFLHFVKKNLRNNTVWVGSIKEQTLFDKLSIPSYLFLFSSISILLIIIFTNPRRIFSIGGITLSSSLQITLISIFLISFIVFGSIAIKYFNKLNDKTNKDILIEKTQSISYEIKDIFTNPKHSDEDIYYDLVNLSNTFLTDINLYDTKGFLINTSRPIIFSQGIISQYINSDALHQLQTSTSPLIYQEERIGNRNYSASYMRIVDNDKEIGYLHIPYIIKQKNLEDKILEFVSAFINIYILWITIALIISILLSNFITQPLRQLQEKMRLVKLDQRNEKIKWSRKDELGNLILSYNAMIDKLDESAKLLLKKEREGAWREMAKQVAHDIKNPLTPMKLSIQQLQRLQSTDIVKFHELFQEVTPALIEQINTLSEIASEFSDYAKDNINVNEHTNIDECLRTVINIFENQDRIEIKYNNPYPYPINVIGDKQQYIRIFNNLIKNSIQAIYNKEDGLIEIEVSEEDNLCRVSIKDNGCGIKAENIDKVFSPEFTTKIEGSGLGLAIVKSIIETIGGKIDFVSQENKGTIFYVYLPVWKQ